MVYSHWLCPGQGSGPESGRMGCMVLRTFHTAPEQGQGRLGYVLIFQVLKLFQVVCFNDISMDFRCSVLASDTASVNGFYIISVPAPVPETASVNTPLEFFWINLATLVKLAYIFVFQLRKDCQLCL